MEKVSAVGVIAPAGALLGAGIALVSLVSAWEGHSARTVTVPVTAVGLLLAAIALPLVKPPRGPLVRGVGRALAAAVSVVGMVVLFQYGADWLGAFPNVQLFEGDEWWDLRPSPVTAAGLTFLGAALFHTAALKENERRTAGLYAAIALVIALTGLVGHAYGASALYGLNRWGGTAISTAIALGAVALGTVFADTSRGVAAIFASKSPGGYLLRRQALAATVAPLVLGWLVLSFMELRYMDDEFGIALLVVSLIVVLVALAMREGIDAQAFASERELLLARERAARAEVTDILESITDAFFAVNKAWCFTYVNREAERLLRRPRVELLGRNLWAEFPESVGGRFREEYQRGRHHEGTVQFEAFFEPQAIWFHVRAYPTSEGMSVYFHDVTQRKIADEERECLLMAERTARAEAELRRVQLERVTESRSRLMRGFSHDVRNPLGVADAQAWLLEQGRTFGDLNQRQLESVRRIRKSLQTSLRLLDELLELNRAESGELDLRPQPTDLAQVARDAVDDYQDPAMAAGLTLEIKAPPGLAARTDPARVKQILANLLSNAVKYAAKGPVTVEAGERTEEAHPGDWIALSVRDSGPGIPRDKLEAVFEEYTRLDPQARPGAGIGLAISRRIARLMGGDLTVASEPGRGSTFTLWLPPNQ